MAEIEILNTTHAQNICSTALSSDIAKYESEISGLTATLTKIKSNWQSDGVDQQSYIKELDKQIKNVEILKNASKGVFNTVSNYATNAQKISDKSYESQASQNIPKVVYGPPPSRNQGYEIEESKNIPVIVYAPPNAF